MATDAVAPVILKYISHNAYPDDESVSSANISSATLASLAQELHKAQDDVKADIRSISRDASSDIDTWISRAKELQADILRSRETARQIVEQAERGKELKDKAGDKRGKLELLENEVRFQDAVQARLEAINGVATLIASIQQNIAYGGVADYIDRGGVVADLRSLQTAEEQLNKLELDRAGGAGAVLWSRMDHLRQRLKDMVRERWNELLVVQVEGRNATISAGLDPVIAAAEGLGLSQGLIADFKRNFEKAIVQPRMSVNRKRGFAAIKISENQIVCNDTTQKSNLESVVRDLSALLDFLASHLPASVSVAVSDSLLPVITSRLEEEWLEPAIPLEVSELASIQTALGTLSGFADKIDQLGCNGGLALRDWVQGIARYWLTKRRESLLGHGRNLVFTGLSQTKTMERIETQMVSNEDELDKGDHGGDEDWDNAWDVPEEESTPASQVQQDPQRTEDDDETSAWDVPDEDNPSQEAGDDNEDAWGWGDGDEDTPAQQSHLEPSQQISPRINGQQTASKPSQREMTLRETYTITDVPDGILGLLRQVITDAETLARPEYASSPVAPAAAALYTLPTLALAIFRATAPTAYNKLTTGNMLIYNDTSCLSDKLRSWQASQPSASRLRLDNDVKALDDFAKRAYSAEMDSQRTILTDLLDGAQGFSNCTAQPFKSACESAVEQTTDRLREVHKQWTPILSNSALLQSIGSLLATVTSKMIREIEDLPDIGEAESKELKSLCDHISSAKDLFAQTTPDGDVRDMTIIYCPNWLKFQYLAEIMESSLADIKYFWKESELSFEFEPEEVVGLVEALFAESSLRRQAIQEIRRGGRA